MNIPRACFDHEAQPSRGIKRRRDDEQMRIQQALHIYPQTNKQWRTVTEEPPWNGHKENYWGDQGLTPILIARNLTLNSDAAPSYKYMFGSHRDLPHFWNIKLKHILVSLRKHAYSNILKILLPKNENFQIQKVWYFPYFCSKHRLWGRGGSNEYPQSIYLSRNMKNNVYPCKPQFYYIKVGFKGINII